MPAGIRPDAVARVAVAGGLLGAAAAGAADQRVAAAAVILSVAAVAVLDVFTAPGEPPENDRGWAIL